MKKTDMTLPTLVVVALLLGVSQQYALEGSWNLVNNHDIKLDPSVEVQFQFVESIGANLTIARSLLVHACYDLSYSYEVKENNIYINFQSILSIPHKCIGNEISTIRSKIDTIFYFVINGTTLSLYDPTGFAPFVLTNADVTVGPAINGGWQTLTVNQNSQYENIYLNGSHALLCGGNGVAIYNITSRSQIIFTIRRSRGCTDSQIAVLSALDSAIFYRVLNSTYLYLYDYSLNNIMYAYYTSFISFTQNLNNVIADINNLQANQTNNTSTALPTPPPPANTTTAAPPSPSPSPAPTPSQTSKSTASQDSAKQANNSSPAPVQPKTIANATTTSQDSKQPIVIKQNPSDPKLSQNVSNQTASVTSNTSNKADTQPTTTPPKSTTNTSNNASSPSPASTNNTSNASAPSNSNTTNTPPSSNTTVPPLNTTYTPPKIINNPPTPTQPSTTSNINTPPPTLTTINPPTPTPTPSPAPVPAPAPIPPVITSAGELVPISTKLLDGKWYISSIGSQGAANFKSYYFILNSSARRFIIYGGCNVQFFIYTLNGCQANFGQPTGTNKVCTPNNDGAITDVLFKNSPYIQATPNLIAFYDGQFKVTAVLVNTPPS